MNYKQLTLSPFTILRQKERHFLRREKVYGQFFTPPEVADFIVSFLVADMKKTPALGVDPACGNGVFLTALVKAGFKSVVGIDVDPKVLNKLPSKARIIVGNGLTTSLEGLGTAVVGNPPFSAKYGRVSDKTILSRFELGKGKSSQAIEILFLERFLQLATSKGLIGVVLPQGVFSALPLEHVRTYIINKATVLGVVSLPRGIFSNGTTSKTCILFAQKGKRKVKAFMGIAKHLHDLPLLLETYCKHQELEHPPAFWVDVNCHSLEPEFYLSSKTIRSLFKPRLPVVPLSELLSEMHCGRTEYGERRKFVNEGVPFISAKTVTPLGIDFSRDERYIAPNTPMDKKRAYVYPGNVLFVRVGVGCAGRASVVTHPSECGVADDYIYIIRTKDREMAYYLAFYLQSKYGILQVNGMKRGVGTVTIPQTLLRNLLVCVPPNSLKNEVKKLYLNMVKEREKNRDEAEKIYNEAIKCIEESIEESR